ncbi:MAG: hypothetical protein Kow001_00210 [Acidobacteriota bacterium]
MASEGASPAAAAELTCPQQLLSPPEAGPSRFRKMGARPTGRRSRSGGRIWRAETSAVGLPHFRIGPAAQVEVAPDIGDMPAKPRGRRRPSGTGGNFGLSPRAYAATAGSTVRPGNFLRLPPGPSGDRHGQARRDIDGPPPKCVR